ncbi:23S rRNA pseudouridine955/2504/2580 synthase [Williamsoniiplasma somnilux]|uniref:RNA pseudouridylate synthase n=1 Tax=Williamsoniiplasma somnilux TaxID=215578 RepID=A0A2K8NYV9_9MOLU|nr:RluA family pseudouridine synthase [Williamsoniiplasma somnilux]ATZ19002.1 23S rRNA pseudouridine955/2504/2580 synthase [Williamsoniiplasma somnilux]
MTKFEINNNDNNQSLFKFVKKSFSTTPLSVIYKWFRKGDIKINGKRIKDQKFLLTTGDLVEVYDTNKPVVRDEFKYVDWQGMMVAYEDENIFIINKAPDIEMHSPVNVSLDDMVKSYLYDHEEYNPEVENSFVVSHVHRLDKLTSGLVIYAKNKVSLDVMLAAIQNKNAIEKYYIAKVSKKFNNDFKTKGWIKYDQEKQISIFTEEDKSEHKNFKYCETEFKILLKQEEFNIVEAKLLTGRKHQIRATLAYYGFPIINDFRYGGKKINNEKMIFLSAYKLIFKNLPEPLEYLNGEKIILDLNIEN